MSCSFLNIRLLSLIQRDAASSNSWFYFEDFRCMCCYMASALTQQRQRGWSGLWRRKGGKLGRLSSYEVHLRRNVWWLWGKLSVQPQKWLTCTCLWRCWEPRCSSARRSAGRQGVFSPELMGFTCWKRRPPSSSAAALMNSNCWAKQPD